LCQALSTFLVHGQVTIIFAVSVGLSVCLFVCAEFFSAIFDPISIKLEHAKAVEVSWGAPNYGISAVSRPKFTIWWGRVEEMLLLNKFFPITYLSCEDIARESCMMVCRWRLFGDFLHPAFSASRVQHISDLHPKFALRPHHVWKYGRHPISDH